jgi:preprotein translocase subunit YajC
MLALIQAATPAPRLGPLMIYLFGFILIVWFVLLRPQQKMQKQHREMVAGLKKGDEVMTEGGIIGSVVHLAEDRITVKTAENTRLVVARGKIARVFSGTEGSS